MGGKHPFIVPVFIPHAGCPHQCAFCNQKAVTSVHSPILKTEPVRRRIETFLQYRREASGPVQISFYGGNFLGLSPSLQKRLLETAADFIRRGRADGIRFSTRPDTVTGETLGLLAEYPVQTVEIGAQSFDNRVLAASLRGHKAETTVQAVGRLRERGYETGLQLMTGLPGQSSESAVLSAREAADLKPDLVRIYPAVVLEGSLLAQWFREEKYLPQDLETAVVLVKRMLEIFRDRGIPVIRMGLQASEELSDRTVVIAGPYHPAFGELVYSEIYLDRMTRLIGETESGDEKRDGGKGLEIRVNPRDLSQARGHGNRNLQRLNRRSRTEHPHGTVSILGEPSLRRGEISVRNC